MEKYHTDAYSDFSDGGRVYRLFDVSNHEIWLWNFITTLQIVDDIDKSLRVNCNNKARKLYFKNNHSLLRSKHIDIKFLVVKE